jgi:hypothetical protein
MIVNISNHIRSGVEQMVSEWHRDCLETNGFILIEHKKIPTPRMRFGRNGTARVEHENIYVFKK